MNYSEQLKHPKWQRKRLEILERDDFQCQCCFDREIELAVHHKRYVDKKMVWEYDNRDLISLCKDCHFNIHLVVEHHVFAMELCEKYKINPTDYYMMFKRFERLIKQNGEGYMEQVLKMLTSMIIKEEEM